jgi:hypothetical protein
MITALYFLGGSVALFVGLMIALSHVDMSGEDTSEQAKSTLFWLLLVSLAGMFLSAAGLVLQVFGAIGFC